ncbi:MAG TPA: pseudouridine-5'-phosphate glycosidase [Candidatus Cloacimonadota bacterium]|nr:pseudouridine-5'-phosphate glycosidase [Candidatus Cloacimonadota bacterium]HPK40028.1 pseudouridine-5'-phosphate glycosidase [Candidatus Cloacimonadota bacterium]
MNKYLKISNEIKDAISNHMPVVALESTIISHGMPYPENVETAKEVERIIRDNGAIPATIAIIKGEIIIGIDEQQMDYLAKNDIKKASRMDLPYIISKKYSASTTVAATMICAQMAGIKVFVTGGIGGVHRGAEESFDISADLQELAKSDMVVVCAGAKAILDLEKTMEYLETFGVLVLGYQTDYLPAFYSQESSIKLLYRADSAEEIVEVIRCKAELGMTGSILVTNPIPSEFSVPIEEMDLIIQQAIAKANEAQIKGKRLTPFLLDAIQKMTNKDSLHANIALIKNNARLGAEIAYYNSKK